MNQAPEFTEVVAGLLVRKNELLFARRAPHQTCSGRWEFPGGKVETGESHVPALTRELREETGVIIHHPVFLFSHLDEENKVHLHFYLVTSWQNEPQAQEGQHIGWYTQSWFTRLDLLPTNRLLLDKLLAAVNRHTNLLAQPLSQDQYDETIASSN